MKCFYHSADLDGHCSGAIVKQKYPQCEMIGINYGQEFPWERMEGDEVIFMVDFGLQPFADMERLDKLCKFHWIDHHKTAIDAAYKKGFIASAGQSLEVGRAGCELVWNHIHGDLGDKPRAVHLLGRYDVWDHSNPDTLPFQYGMRQIKDTLPDNQKMWSKLFKSEEMCADTIRTGQLILAYEESQNAKFCGAYSFETSFDGMDVICANRGFTNSKLFDSVYDPDKHHMMVTFVRMKLPAEKWTVSMYSTREDVECGEVAVKYGGGGHKGAAGFQCDKLPFSV